MGKKKKFVDEKDVDQEKHQNGNVHNLIIGETYDKNNRFHFFDEKKEDCFLEEVKQTLQGTKTPAPPPQISNGASLLA